MHNNGNIEVFSNDSVQELSDLSQSDTHMSTGKLAIGNCNETNENLPHYNYYK